MSQDVPLWSSEALASLAQGSGDGAVGAPPDWSDIEQRFKVFASIGLVARLGVAGPNRTRTDHYDIQHLSWAVVHSIINHVTPDESTNREFLIRFLKPLLEMMDRRAGVPSSKALHEEALGFVVDHLTNASQRHKPHIVTRLVHRDGQLVEEKLEVRILVQVYEERTNEPVFRVSTEFTNIYLGSLALDIADATIANTALVEEHIRRGRFADAQARARQARQSSEAYKAQVERYIEETRRNIDRVDWSKELPATLAKAEDHVRERLLNEQRLFVWASDMGAPSNEHREQLQAIAHDIRQCMIAHSALHSTIQNARDVFLAENNKQRNMPPVLDPRPHLRPNVLNPALRLGPEGALEAFAALTTAFGGFQVPAVPTLTTDLAYMLRPKREYADRRVFLEEEETLQVESLGAELPWEQKPDIDRRLTVEVPTPLEEIMRRAQQDGYDERELELLARVALESVGEQRGVAPVQFGAPAFKVGRLNFDEGGVYVLPGEGGEHD